jgi:simple sugar transport system substrate-binding protein
VEQEKLVVHQLAGQLSSKQVVFPGILVTQCFLLKEQIKSMEGLRAKLPNLNLANVASAGWITSTTF